MTRMRITCLCGSLRADSTNMRLLHAFRDHAPADFRIDIVEGLGDLPIFNPDFEDTGHPRVEALANAIGASDGLLIASPEYAHGIPGGLKNALDWLVSRFEIPDKPVMLAHASTRSETSRAHLREVLKTMSCRVYSGPEFELHLMGKSPAEMESVLGSDAVAERIRATLSAFALFSERD